jgi:hypothetical protein
MTKLFSYIKPNKKCATGGKADDRANDESLAAQQEHAGDFSTLVHTSTTPQNMPLHLL